jgi:hypothetical protein
MSCFGPNYLPQPPREWTRTQNICTYANSIPLPPSNTVNFSGVSYNIAVLKKGNILQYKNNSSNITKNQRYAKIATGNWTNRTTTWASQSDTNTNPNTRSLKRVGYLNINIAPSVPVPTNQPLTCTSTITTPVNNAIPQPYNNGGGGGTNPNPPPVVPPPSTNTATPTNSVVPNVITIPPSPQLVVPEGGQLVCSISENICTGEVISTSKNSNCAPTSASDVPGQIQIFCYSDALPTYYPRTQLTNNNSLDKWPVNSKLIKSAIPVQIIQSPELPTINNTIVNQPNYTNLNPNSKNITYLNLEEPYAITSPGIFFVQSNVNNYDITLPPVTEVFQQVVIVNNTQSQQTILTSASNFIYSTLFAPPNGETSINITPSAKSDFTSSQSGSSFYWIFTST